jgi:hypothetical protein
LRSRQKELIKDLAKLVAKYSARDWEPIVRLLRAGKAKIPELTAAIESLGKSKSKKPSKESAKKTKSSSKTPHLRAKKSSSKKKISHQPGLIEGRVSEKTADEHLDSWIRDMLNDSSPSELRELYSRTIGRKQAPKSREAVTRELTEFLRRSSVDQRASFVNLLQRQPYDPTEDYRRWTQMISGAKKIR